MIDDSIKKRIVDEANYIIRTKNTLRKTARTFNVSKSTVFNDVAYLLPTFDKDLYKKVKKVLLFNKNQRYRRGGISAHLNKK